MPTAKQLSYTELVEKAKQAGILHHGKTRAQLLVDLKVENPDIFVIDRAAEYSHEVLADLKKDNMVIPAKTIGWSKDREIIEEYLSYNDMAFNNVDLTDPKLRVQHIFGKKNVKCHCGMKFRIEREYTQKIGAGSIQFKPGAREGGPEKTVVENATERICPQCGRKWIYHDKQTAQAARGKMAETFDVV